MASLVLGGQFVIGTTTGLAQTPGDEVYTFFTLAGRAGQNGSADGTRSAARFSCPSGVALDTTGNVIVADSFNHTIRKITPGGVVSTLAGQAGNQGSADGTGSVAGFCCPKAVAVDNAGSVYVADYCNRTIRKVTAAGVVSTLAGEAESAGSTDGPGSAARFSLPNGVAVDSAGNVYVADDYNYTIRKITPGGVVSTLAGRAGSQGSADGTGSAARFVAPCGVAVDAAGNVYVADTGNYTIRKITPDGVVTTLAGQVGSPGSADGTGSAARFNQSYGVAVDGAGNVYIADTSNHTIRMGIRDRVTSPQIAVEPQDQQVVRGYWVSFEVIAAGAHPLFYQWRKDGVDLMDGGPITGAREAKLNIQNVKPQDAGSYQVAVSNALGVVVSRPAVLTVSAPWPGALRWVSDVKGQLESPAIGPDGTVYVASLGYVGIRYLVSQYAVYALDGATGASKSIASGSGRCPTPAIGVDGTVYLSTSDGLRAINGRNWVFHPGSAQSPAIGADGTIYVAGSGKVFAVDGATGLQKWASVIENNLAASVVIGADGTVYSVTEAGTVYAIDGSAGVRKWTSTVGWYPNVPPAIGADGTIYIINGAYGNLYALDGFTGARKWVAAGCDTSPVIGTDGTIIIGAGGTVFARDGATGARKWSFAAGGSSTTMTSAAIAADETIIIGSGNTVYGLDYATGTKKWSYSGSGPFTSPALGTDGTIYFTSFGSVYALHGSAPLANSPWPMERHDPQHTSRATSLSLPSRLDRVTLANGQFQLQWNSNGVLQSADEIQGPWKDLATTNSSYSTTPEGARRFFRLRSR